MLQNKLNNVITNIIVDRMNQDIICFYLNVKFPDGGTHVRKSEFFETISLSVGRDDSEGAAIAGRLGQISADVNAQVLKRRAS
jgi:hypothetical protein